MNIEIGVKNVAKIISFETTQSADEVSAAVDQSLNGHTPLQLTDEKGRRVIVPSEALGYVLLGTEEVHPVGFGAL